jgi:hypothetical protein
VTRHRDDDYEINPNRSGFWGALSKQKGIQHFTDFSPFAEWELVGEGAYGKVFLVPLFPPISRRGKRETKAVVKAAKKSEIAGELNTEIEVSSRLPSLLLPSFSLPSLSLTRPLSSLHSLLFPSSLLKVGGLPAACVC